MSAANAPTGHHDREDQRLRLQRMEVRLVEALLEHPDLMSRTREHQIRYAIALAALDTFQPGAARRGGRTKHPDVRIRAGTGLGLSVAEMLIRAHGGSIVAVNRPEGGSRFEIRLPRPD